MAVVLLAIASAGILMPFTAGAALRQEGLRRTLASRLATEQIEKVSRTPFNDILAAWGNFEEAAGELRDALDEPVTSEVYADFSRTTACRYVYTPEQKEFSDPALIKVTVRVSHNGAKMVEYNKLLAR